MFWLSQTNGRPFPACGTVAAALLGSYLVESTSLQYFPLHPLLGYSGHIQYPHTDNVHKACYTQSRRHIYLADSLRCLGVRLAEMVSEGRSLLLLAYLTVFAFLSDRAATSHRLYHNINIPYVLPDSHSFSSSRSAMIVNRVELKYFG